jgi:hypothetical protein
MLQNTKAKIDHTNETKARSQLKMNTQAHAHQLTMLMPQMYQDIHANIKDNPP